MFDLVNGLEVDHHIPGQKVINQNDLVLDEFDEFKKEAKVYFIVAGNYKVESLMFNMGKKQKDIKEDAFASFPCWVRSALEESPTQS